jgi:hypothetical protein
LWGRPHDVEFRVFFKAVRDSLPEPPTGDGLFGLSGPGILEGLIEQAGMTVLNEGEADCPFDYTDFGVFWRAGASGGSVQHGEDERASESKSPHTAHPFPIGTNKSRT